MSSLPLNLKLSPTSSPHRRSREIAEAVASLHIEYLTIQGNLGFCVGLLFYMFHLCDFRVSSWFACTLRVRRGSLHFRTRHSANCVVGDQEIFSDWLQRGWGICSECRLFLNPWDFFPWQSPPSPPLPTSLFSSTTFYWPPASSVSGSMLSALHALFIPHNYPLYRWGNKGLWLLSRWASIQHEVVKLQSWASNPD